MHFIFLQWKSSYLDSNFIEIAPKSAIKNIPALIQMMAWCQTGDRPLSELMMAQFPDAYMRHSASVSCDNALSYVSCNVNQCWPLQYHTYQEWCAAKQAYKNWYSRKHLWNCFFFMNNHGLDKDNPCYQQRRQSWLDDKVRFSVCDVCMSEWTVSSLG